MALTGPERAALRYCFLTAATEIHISGDQRPIEFSERLPLECCVYERSKQRKHATHCASGRPCHKYRFQIRVRYIWSV